VVTNTCWTMLLSYVIVLMRLSDISFNVQCLTGSSRGRLFVGTSFLLKYISTCNRTIQNINQDFLPDQNCHSADWLASEFKRYQVRTRKLIRVRLGKSGRSKQFQNFT